MRFPAAFIAFAAVSIAGCAPGTNFTPVEKTVLRNEEREERQLILDQYQHEAQRIYGVVGPIFRAATELCAPDKVGPTFGLFDIATLDMYSKDYRPVAEAQLGVTKGLTFTYVEPNGPLARAGVQPGDELVSVNGKTYAGGRRGYAAFYRDYLAYQSADAVRIMVEHDNELKTFAVTPEIMPRLAVSYDFYKAEINAFADGKSLHVYRGLLRAISSDDALAMVLGHELAHNCRRHIETQNGNAALGSLIDVLATAGGGDTGGFFEKMGDRAYSQDFEREADYYGLYYIARAGRSLPEAIKMSRLLAVETSGNSIKVPYNASHPSDPERFLRMQASAQEIEAKVRNGRPLVPNKTAP